jgi:hypothetical protein
MAYESLVVLDLMPAIYDRPGRITQILGGEDEPKTVMLNRPFVPGQNGRPVPVQPGMQPMPSPDKIKNYNLREGKYAISVSVGKSYQTRLQEGQDEIGGVLEKAPQLMPIIGPTYFKFRDFPGSKEISELLKRVRDKQFPGLEDDEEGGLTLEQAQAQLQQMGAAMQEMQQQLQAAMMELKVDKAKQEATLAKAQMDNATKAQEGEREREHKELIAKLNAQTKLLEAVIQSQARSTEGEADREQNLVEGELQREHEDRADEFEAAHETTLALLDQRQRDRELKEPGR